MTPDLQDWLTALFGWMSLINMAVYALAAGLFMFARDWIMGVQTRVMDMPRDVWERVYVEYLGRYKLLITVFNVVPWIALLIVG